MQLDARERLGLAAAPEEAVVGEERGKAREDQREQHGHQRHQQPEPPGRLPRHRRPRRRSGRRARWHHCREGTAPQRGSNSSRLGTGNYDLRSVRSQ